MDCKYKVICLNCNKPFYVKKYRIKEGVKFCSHRCHLLFAPNLPNLKKPKDERGAVKICPICKKKFYRKRSRIVRAKRSFCSTECAGIGKRKDPAKKQEKSIGSIQRICRNKNCNNIFYVFNGRLEAKRGKFCSKKCFYDANREAFKADWSDEKFLFAVFKSHLFGKAHAPNKLDKQIILTRIKIHKFGR